MLPFIEVFGHSISMYWLSAIVGAVLACAFALLRACSSRFRTSVKDVFFLFLLCVFGAYVGATLLQAVGLTIQNIANPGFWTWQNWLRILRAGGVFYGGLIGGFLTALIYIRKRKLDFRDITDIMVPSILLFHAVGRLGCFFAGCCFGREVAWGIMMPTGAVLFPVQLIEAGFNLLVLAEILIFRPERERPGILLPMYLVAYALMRFFVEFMRGDVGRGIFILSTSQWISLAILLTLGIIFMIKRKKRRDKTNRTLKEPFSLEGHA